MGATLGKSDSPKKGWMPETKLEAKMVEAMQRRESHGSSVKSFNTIILKFPKIDESLRKCKAIFEQFGSTFIGFSCEAKISNKLFLSALMARQIDSLAFRSVITLNSYVFIPFLVDEDSNGTIDQEELKKSFSKLELSFTEEEINDLFEACDINEDLGMKFNEFIVLLCLVYLLKDDPAAVHAKSQIGMPHLEATFETLVDTFVFLDKNKDGYVSKNEMVQAINETTTGERSSGRIAMKRFVVTQPWLDPIEGQPMEKGKSTSNHRICLEPCNRDIDPSFPGNSMLIGKENNTAIPLPCRSRALVSITVTAPRFVSTSDSVEGVKTKASEVTISDSAQLGLGGRTRII
ncbi:hypothetical protein V8G54_001948 [Vigna mungo]|uniref:EF-hand domain-containing protein n=1 Tax=Vigna mungo TaxID=3915 RepID=A0AAQ3SCC6_VIGMU